MERLRHELLHHLAAVMLLFVMLVTAHGFISRDIYNNIGVQNLETPWHVLLTGESMAQPQASKHAFLPIVTLGQPTDRYIPWGATVADSEGRYYYTSATSPTFVLPYIWFRAFQLDPTIENLAGFNFLLQTVLILLLYSFVYKLLQFCGVTSATAAASSAAAMTICIFSREALLAFGIVYWYHGIYLIALVAALWLILYAVSSTTAPSRRLLLAIGFACFFGAWIDWTGFIFNAGAAVLLFVFGPTRRNRWIAISMVGGTALAGLVIIAHYGAVIDLATMLTAMKGRFAQRSPLGGRGTTYNVLALIQGYALSFVPFLVTLLAGCILVLRARIKPEVLKLLIMMILLASIPLVQN